VLLKASFSYPYFVGLGGQVAGGNGATTVILVVFLKICQSTVV
jgi:hypothetical protein